jgi:hypothetical protein
MSLESLLARLQSEAVTPKPIDAPWGGDTGPSLAPFVVTLATPNGTCEVAVPRDQYDPEAVAVMVDQCRALPVDKDPRRWRSAEIAAPDGRAIKAATTNGWGQSAWQCLARGYFPRGYVLRALEPVDLDADAEQTAIAQEAENLREFFTERAAILEHGGEMSRGEAEHEAARIVSTFARNRRYTWASLREALKGYPLLVAQVPATAAPQTKPCQSANLCVMELNIEHQ